MRNSIVLLLAAALLAGCGEAPTTAEYDGRFAAATAEATVDTMVAGGAQRGLVQLQARSGESYIYDHALTISMASDHIKARFDRARDRCQNEVALKCKIMSASYRVLGNPDAPLPVADLSVALPHDSVAVFEAGLTTSLPGENPSDVVVKSRSTNAQNVTNQVKDMNGRLSQLVNYRDRMTELSKRPKSTTDDLMKIEAEISRTQSEIEQLEGQRRDMAERIAKENLSISFVAQSTAGDALQPIADVWQSSLRLLAQSAAAVLAVMIGILPWIPVFAAGFFPVRWLWRRLRRKPA